MGASGIGSFVVPGLPAARIASRNAPVASAGERAGAVAGGEPVAAAGAVPTRASHSARVGSRSIAARLRPHAAQNTPGPGGSPQ